MEDFQKRKRIIYAVLGTALLVVLGLVIYRALAPKAPSLPGPAERVGGRLIRPPTAGLGAEKFPEDLRPGETLSVGPEQTLIRITDFPILSPVLNKGENKILFYKKEGGGLYSSDFNGQNQEKISNLTIVGMVDAVWAPTRDRAVVVYLDQETVRSFIHIGTSSVAVLPQDVQSISWSPDGKSLAYLVPQEGRLNLITTDAVGKNSRVAALLPRLDADLIWVSKDILALETRPSGLAEGFIFTLSRASALLTRLIGPEFGLTSRWSPGGSAFLTASLTNNGVVSGIVVRDSLGKVLAETQLRTLPEKCTFVGLDEVYCGLPLEIASDALWPDEYLTGELNTPDKIVVYNIKTGLVRTVFDQVSFDVSRLIVTQDKTRLFFISRVDGTLWGLKLK